MKIAIIADIHFGCRNESKHFYTYFEKFFNTIFFPYLIENNIKTVVQCGDLWQRRKYTNHQALFEAKRMFFDKFKQHNIKLVSLLGNHDIFYKDSVEISASKLFLENVQNVEIIEKPTSYKIGKHHISLIPWICDSNRKECMEYIENDINPNIFGHFEIQGFMMQNGSELSDGMEQSVFDKYKYVFSGHYHHKSNQNNIWYCGAFCEMNWLDYNSTRGFYIFDLDKQRLEFIENPYSIFKKILYDDSLNKDRIQSYINTDKLEAFKDCYVKVIVKNRNDSYLFDLFFSTLEKVNPIDISIVEDITVDLDEAAKEIDETEDTLTLLSKYVDSVQPKGISSDKLKTVMRGLYTTALTLEK